MTREAYSRAVAYILRQDVLAMTSRAGSGHLTSCLSAADLWAVLWCHLLRFDTHAERSVWNDHCILSKGHSAPLLYSMLSLCGLIPREELATFRTFNARLEGHPTPRCPTVLAATGSLGQGLAIAAGCAWAARSAQSPARQYVVMGDAETDEGSVWEAAALMIRLNLTRATAIIDANGLGQSVHSVSAESFDRFCERWRGFGWAVFVCDGHSHEELLRVMHEAGAIDDRPSVIVARTIKGYGLHDMEGQLGFHGKALSRTHEGAAREALQQRFSVEAHDAQSIQLPISLHTPVHVAKKMNVDEHAHAFKMPSVDQSMRRATGLALAALGATRKELVVLDADVQNSTGTEAFGRSFPERFIECGIAEQSMIGTAVGLAQVGKKPVVATFGAFLTRAADQIRMAAISNANLCIIGSHAGVSIGEDGPSQMALEDIALMRAIPSSVILSPSDAISAVSLTRCMVERSAGITYLRTLRQEVPHLYSSHETFYIGGGVIRIDHEEPRVCVIATGATVHEANAAVEWCSQQKIAIVLLDCYSIKPLPAEMIRDAIGRARGRVIIAEDHYAEGGLGDAVYAECVDVIEQSIHCAVRAVPVAGNGEQLRAWAKIDAQAIIQAIQKLA